MTSTLRVVVVEDSLTVRKRLVELLGSAGGFEVVGEAGDGKTGIELVQRLRPDVVTMDMMLPVMTGLAATEYIMAYCPTPILIVSASTNRGELFRTYDALAAGAVDVLDKPLGVEPEEEWGRRLVAAVRMTARIRVITHPRAKLGGRAEKTTAEHGPLPRGGRRVVAIGASTGGPGAILQILRGLPHDFPSPILLVIHIEEPFGRALADWLDAQTPLRVAYAEDGMPVRELPPGSVCMATPGRHLVVAGSRLRFSDAAALHSCRPSVDVLFQSVAAEARDEAVGCLLTGMGRDGAAGLLAMRQAGAATIAQDEPTSVVFGMPGEAVKLGAADRVVPLGGIAGALVALAGRRA